MKAKIADKATTDTVYTLHRIILSRNEKPDLAVVGLWWCIIIILFPIWIWFVIIYKIFYYIGKLLNGVQVSEEEQQDNDYY